MTTKRSLCQAKTSLFLRFHLSKQPMPTVKQLQSEKIMQSCSFEKVLSDSTNFDEFGYKLIDLQMFQYIWHR